MRRGGKSVHKHNAFGGRGCCQLHTLLPAAIIHAVAARETNGKAACGLMERYRAIIHISSNAENMVS